LIRGRFLIIITVSFMTLLIACFLLS